VPIVYLDETGFERQEGRSYAWSPAGQKVYGEISGIRRQRTSLIGGYLDRKLIAPLLFQGTCNTQVFNAWLQETLLPVLKPGTLLVLDNASFHRSEQTQRLVKQAGCQLLFLPPYSPHLNPIEKLWANLKRFCRDYHHSTLDEAIRQSGYLLE